jgi:hypothetical protein
MDFVDVELGRVDPNSTMHATLRKSKEMLLDPREAIRQAPSPVLPEKRGCTTSYHRRPKRCCRRGTGSSSTQTALQGTPAAERTRPDKV